MLYLDQAATSWPKPAPVLAAMEHWYRQLGVSALRGSSDRCNIVAEGVRKARSGVGKLLGMPPDRVAFTSGATESINLFLRGYLQPGDRVLTTAFEHSSVVRPLVALQAQRQIEIEVVPPSPDGSLDPDVIEEALRARPRLLLFTHASNVTGAVFDAAKLCAMARHYEVNTLLDASQTAGHLRLDDINADAIAASAHKALCGPPGLGVLGVHKHVALTSSKQGGTGSSRALAEHPTEWPAAFEAGTPNTPAILGLGAALAWCARPERPTELQRIRSSVAKLAETLAEDSRYRVIPSVSCEPPTLLSFTRPDLDPAEIGAILASHDIHVRTGHHCAPWLHEHFGTEPGGTVRISPGPEVSANDILRVSEALAD